MFELVKGTQAASLYIAKEADDFAGLSHVAEKIQKDIELVTGVAPKICDAMPEGYSIIPGTIGKNPVIDEMIANGKLNVSQLDGKRESYALCLVDGDKLVIAGTETVATLHGMYHISEKIGVSPWVYWGDAIPRKQAEIVWDESIEFTSKEPSVKFRGFFMNDEWPSLGNFVMNTFGDFNVKFYDRVFDLLLRLKGNYFWPAMWSASLCLDGSKEDPLANVKLATDLGITIGNSHHEPLMRSSEEWDKVKTDTNNVGYGKDWNYYTNGEGLYRYWEDGVERNKDFKHMITIGMRGERDTTMLPEGSSIQENVELLRKIIADQLEIIKAKGCGDMPKMLALYKEVEDYYYGGDGVEGLKDWAALDDTILLLSDDNFGNVRTLPTKENRDRKAGFGLYYHFDYHGSPVSYEWVNSTPLPKVWEQLTMAYEYGIKDLWIVNVGDIRPQELPLSYYMALAGARICSRIAPSWISPKMPRVFTLLKTFFRSPTPVASVCISPRPLYTLSNCSLTRLKDCCSFSSSVFCSFSSTVWRISSRRLPLSACMAAIRVSIVVRMFSSFCSLSSAPVFMRCSMNCSWSVTAFCSAVWRTASCSLSSRRRVFCASATCLCAFA